MSPKCSSVVVTTSSSAEVEPREDDVAPVRRRGRDRHLSRLDADERSELRTDLSRSASTRSKRARSPRPDERPLLVLDHRVQGRGREARRCRPGGTRTAPERELRAASSNVTRGILPGVRHLRSANPHGYVRVSDTVGFRVRVVLADPPAYTPLTIARLRSRSRAAPTSSSRRASVRGRRVPGRIHGPRVVLSVSSRMRVVAAPARGKGARASRRDGEARHREAGRPPRPVVRGGRGRPLALPPALAGRVHRTRHRPRRTASKTTLWQALFGRCDRVVVHSERVGAPRHFGVPGPLRVVSHPAFRSEIQREDDGRTASRSGSSGRTREPRTRSRPSSGSTAPGCSSRAIPASCSRPCSRWRRPGRVAARLPVRGEPRRALPRPRSHSSLPRRDRRVRRAPPGLGAGVPRSSTTSEGSGRSSAASARAPVSRATSTR